MLTFYEKRVLIFLLLLLLLGGVLRFFYYKKEYPIFFNGSSKDLRNTIELKHPIDINKSSFEELESIPGIGPTIALEIIKYRDEKGKIKNIEELINIKGIGKKNLERFKQYITVE